jgi:HEAT repeats
MRTSLPAIAIAMLAGLVLAGSSLRADAASVEELARILMNDKNFKLRANAARLLGKAKDARAQSALTASLQDDNPIVRSSACAALSSFDDVRIITELEKMEKDKDEAVKKACRAALKSLQRPKTTLSTGKRPSLDLSELRAQGQKVADARHQSLHAALKQEVESGKGWFAVEDNGSRGYKLIGGVSCEDQIRGKDTIMFCKVNMVLARMPGKVILGSIGATGGASMSDPKSAADRTATQNALFSAFAKSLSEDLVHVVNQDRAQNGEETLK